MEWLIIDIELKDRNKTKEFFQNIHSKLEDILFSIIQKLPERFIPSPLMNWLSRYLDRRIAKLKQESIKMTWQNMYLQEAVDDIRNRQKDTQKSTFGWLIQSIGASLTFKFNFLTVSSLLHFLLLSPISLKTLSHAHYNNYVWFHILCKIMIILSHFVDIFNGKIRT